jgi:hypothetical protein
MLGTSAGKAIALTPAAVRHKLQAIDRSALDGLRDHALLAIALQTGDWPRSRR